MIEAVLFDLDDTLSDSRASIAAAIEATRDEVPAPHHEGLDARLWGAIEQIAFDYRDGIVVNRAYWKLAVDPASPWTAALPGAAEEAVKAVADAFRSRLRPVAFSDAARTLGTLAARYRLGLLTNSPRGDINLTLLGLRQWFGHVLMAGDPYRKPHPRAFAAACEAMLTTPERTVYVGDSLASDVEGAAAAGLVPVWLDRLGERHPLPPGCHRVGTLDQLPALLLAIEATESVPRL